MSDHAVNCNISEKLSDVCSCGASKVVMSEMDWADEKAAKFINGGRRASQTSVCFAPDALAEAIATALRAARAAGMPQWQSMDTAPKDGTKILAHCQPTHVETGKPMSFNYISVVWWRGEQFKDSFWPWRHALNDSAAEPTHWQPLPAPPAET